MKTLLIILTFLAVLALSNKISELEARVKALETQHGVSYRAVPWSCDSAHRYESKLNLMYLV